ncbi:hypothetical protein RB653_006357 [Dictyostelium firmibasis]|uniref:Ubiquitin-like domain-containing protein n=1 Tax=Dictyostelium firmibasis TaxID=79012 RepID=A0AAN7UBW7_9MYCE
MKVNCQLPNINENTLELDIDKDSGSINDIKSMIYNLHGVPIEHQIIEIDNKKLPSKFDKKKLSNFKVTDSTNIRVLYDLNGGCGAGCDCCGLGGGCRCEIL